MIKIIRAAVVAAASLFALAALNCAASAANLAKNGSFEKPDVPSGQTEQVLTGEQLCFGMTCTRGWAATGPVGSDILLVGPGYTCCGGVTFPAEDGEQSICLTGNNRKAGGVKQKIVTTPGKMYRITFWIGNIVNKAQGLGTKSTVRVYAAGQLLASKTNDQGVANKVTWKMYTVDFTAEDSRTTIKFINGDKTDDGYNGLDSVRVDELP